MNPRYAGRRLLRLLAVVLLGVLGAAGAAPASAQQQPRLSEIRDDRAVVRFLFTPATSDPVDPASVVVTVDGRRFSSRATPLRQVTAPPRRTAVLVMDISGSMDSPLPNGAPRIDGAKQAALAYLGAVPPDVAVGLVSFATDVRVVVAPTRDRARLRAAVTGLQVDPDGSTAMFRAVQRATAVAGRGGVRSVLLLTDGENNDPANFPKAGALQAVRGSGVRLDAVGLGGGTSPASRRDLGDLTRQGGGGVTLSATAAQLTQQFRQAAERLTGQLLVEARKPADLRGGTVSLRVTGLAGPTRVSAEATFALSAPPGGAAPTPTPTAAPSVRPPPRVALDPGPLETTPVALVGLALLFLGVLGLGSFALTTAVPAASGTRISRRLARYTLTGPVPVRRGEEVNAVGESALLSGAVGLAERVVRRRGFETDLRQRLEAGGIPLRPAEWLLVHLGVAVLVPLLVLLVTAGNVVLTAAALVLGVAVPFLLLGVREQRRRERFADQLPDVLQSLAGSLRAGYSLPQAVDAVVREANEPMSAEFGRALLEARLGVPMEEALDSVANRMRSRDWQWAVLAIRIQREVGGNLAELLTSVADTLRERARLARQVRVLSAEGRLSAIVLGALPFVFAIYLAVTRPDYLSRLVTDPLGLIMLGAMVLLMVIGTLWMRKIVAVKV